MRIVYAHQLADFIHAPILHSFGDMAGLQLFAARQISDGAGDFEDAVVGASRKVEAGNLGWY